MNLKQAKRLRKFFYFINGELEGWRLNPFIKKEYRRAKTLMKKKGIKLPKNNETSLSKSERAVVAEMDLSLYFDGKPGVTT